MHCVVVAHYSSSCRSPLHTCLCTNACACAYPSGNDTVLNVYIFGVLFCPLSFNVQNICYFWSEHNPNVSEMVCPPQPFCRWNSAFNEHTGPRLAYVYNPNHFNCENFERQYIIFIFADGRVSIHRFRYIIRCIGMLRVSIFFFRFFHICYATAAECFWNISCRDIIQKRHAFHITDVCYFHCCCCCWKWVESTEITSHRFSLFVCLSSLLVGGCQCSAIIHASFYHVEQSFISVFCLIKKERPREWRNENRERKYDFCHRRLQVSPTLLARRATKKCIRTGSRGLQRQQKRMYVSLSSFLSLSLAASLKSNWSGRISLCAQNI